MKKLMLEIAFSISCLSGMCQNLFQKEYNTGYAAPYLVDTLPDGYLVAGTTDTLAVGGLDGLIMKIDKWGNVIWSVSIGGHKNEQLFSMSRIHNGNYIFAGTTASFVNNSSDSGNMYLVKIDTAGNILWSESIGTKNNDVANAVEETTDHGFILAGSSADSLGKSAVYLVKTDSTGVVQWQHIYNDGLFPFNVATGIVQTTDGGYGVSGYTARGNTPHDSSEMFIMKTSPSGIINMSHSYEDVGTSLTYNGVFGYDIIQNSAGHLVAAGADGGYYSVVTFAYSPILIECDTSGNLLYSTAYGLNSGECSAHSVRQTQDGGYILGGSMGNFFPMMLKTDAATTKRWCYFYDTYSYSNPGYGFCARQTSDKGYVLTGYSETSSKIHVVKTTDSGKSACNYSIPMTGGGASRNDSFTILNTNWFEMPMNDSSFRVSSTTHTLNPSTSILCTSVGITDVVSGSDVVDVYPNPSTGVFILRDENEKLKVESVEIYNVLGERVDFIPSTTDYSPFTIDLSSEPNGVYLYRVLSGGKFIGEGKLIIEKQ